MALVDKKLTELAEKISAPNGSWLHFVDPTDISQSPEGSSFKIKKENLITTELTAENFGTFSNSLDLEDAIYNEGLFTYTNILGLQVKTTYLNIKDKLKAYFDTLYQSVLVSGTNIKTINGNSILGSGDLVVSGGGTTDTIAQSGWKDSIFNSDNIDVGGLHGYGINGGNINNISSPNIDDFNNFLSFGSGTSANGGYRYIDLGNSVLSAYKARVGLTMFGTFCIYANSSADTLIRIGIGNQYSLPVESSNGLYLQITGNSAVFKSAYSFGYTSTAAATLDYSASINNEVPYMFMIHLETLTKVNVKLVKYDGTVMINTDITTNIPTADPNLSFISSIMGCIQTAGSNRLIMGISRFGIGTKKPNFLNSF